jgi:predicted small secreted protein
MRRIVLLAIVAAGLLTTACNTVSGAGEDLQSAGQAVSTTAEDAKQ